MKAYNKKKKPKHSTAFIWKGNEVIGLYYGRSLCSKRRSLEWNSGMSEERYSVNKAIMNGVIKKAYTARTARGY